MAISLKAAGTWARMVTDNGTVAIPGTPAAGDRMFLFGSWKTYTITVATPSGWNLVDDFSDGAVAAGNGTGSVHNAVYYRDWQSGDAAPAIDYSTAPTEGHWVIMLWQKGASETWDTSPGPLAVHSAIASASTWNATASATVTVPSGGVVMLLVGFRDDSGTMTRDISSIGGTGPTWNGNYVESPGAHFSSTTGFDMSGDLGHRFVTTGSAGVSLTGSGVIAAAETGTATWVVLGVTASGALIGISPAVSTAVGNLTTQIKLAGLSPAVSSASSALTTQIKLVGNSGAVSSASGILTLPIFLIGDSTAGSAVSGNLTTQIKLVGDSGALSSASSVLTTQIPLAGSAVALSGVSGILTNEAAALAGVAVASSNVSGILTTSIVLQGSSASITSAGGSLLTSIALGGSLGALSGASAVLTTSIKLAGSSDALSGASANLTVGAGDTALAGSASSVSGVSGVLTTQIKLVSQSDALSGAVALLNTSIKLAGITDASSGASSVLTVPLLLAGSVQSVSSVGASLSTGIKLAGSCQAYSGTSESRLMGQILVVRSIWFGPDSYASVFGTTPRITYKNNNKLNRNPPANGST